MAKLRCSLAFVTIQLSRAPGDQLRRLRPLPTRCRCSSVMMRMMRIADPRVHEAIVICDSLLLRQGPGRRSDSGWSARVPALVAAALA